MKKNINLVIALSPILYVEDTGFLNKVFVFYFSKIEPLIPRFKLFRAFPQWFFGKTFKYTCGYMLSACDYLSLYIAQNTTKFNDPERT